jgi:hypothetical protein
VLTPAAPLLWFRVRAWTVPNSPSTACPLSDVYFGFDEVRVISRIRRPCGSDPQHGTPLIISPLLMATPGVLDIESRHRHLNEFTLLGDYPNFGHARCGDKH